MIYPFDNALSAEIWRNKYRYSGSAAPEELSIELSWARVAKAVASIESRDQTLWRDRFSGMLQDFQFLPAGRILAGAGTDYESTLFNCFVMGALEDSLPGIFDSLKESAITMQWGGGIGIDFSTLRPRGAPVQSRATISSGPVSFMRVWDAMCATMLSTGARRGAMMGTLRCDHPDIEEFVDAKRQAGALTNFNLSVQITDEFVRAVDRDEVWPLVFPVDGPASAAACKWLRWPGHAAEVPCVALRSTPARSLWQRIMDAAYATAEPGVLFVDRINQSNNLYYREHITSTNPCGEIPLPPYGACNLGSINLTACVEAPFSARARMRLDRVAELARLATRFLDNVIDLARFPLPAQLKEAQGTRRIGLGITGLADALIMLGLHYDSDAARQLAGDVMSCVRDAAYAASIDLARERGAFPYFDREAYLAGAYVSQLPPEIRDGIAANGIRNSHLLALAPAGTISVLANNISSGIEPVFAFEMERRVLGLDGQPTVHALADYAFTLWRHRAAPGSARLPACFVTAQELAPEAHLAMQAALQPLVDNSIAKTINVPGSIGVAEFAKIFRRAHELGLKGCTVFRPNAVTGSVLRSRVASAPVHCCSLDREAD
jgi:ribonucleoside-diphosphate reductase alpha chain